MATILITGASSGLGAQMARRYAARGDSLALCARRLDRLEELREELLTAHSGLDVQIARADVTDERAVAEAFDEFAEHFGTIDVIIANAGTGDGAALGTGGIGTNRETLVTNVLGMLAQVEAAMTIFRRQARGHLVLVSSFAAVRGMRGKMNAYSASKAAVASMAEGLRVEGVPGLAVTTLYPGYIATEMTGSGRAKPFMTDVVTGVDAMIRAIDARRRKAFIPAWPWAVLARVFPLLPAAVVRRLT